MTPLRLFRLAVVGLAVVVAGSGSHADAAPLRVRVRGSAKLTMRASREQVQPGTNELVLSGLLTDDSGGPLPFQSVTVRVTRETDPHDARVAEGLRRAQGCDRTSDAPPAGGAAPPARPTRGPKSWGVRVAGPTDAPEIVVVTDEDGRFCFRARIDPDRYKATGVFVPGGQGASQGLALLDGAQREIAFDLTRRGLALRFDPTPRVVQLDTPRYALQAVAILDDDATPKVAPGLSIALSNEQAEIARAVTDPAGRAHFFVPGDKLGPPGRGELRVAFAGDQETTPASFAEEVERHVKVAVKVAAAERGELTPAIPEEGIPLVAEVSSSLGPVAEGSIEARVGDVVVGAAPVERGLARLLLTFTAQGSEAVVRLRYVPQSPWYEPLSEPSIHVPIRGPSLLSKAPILVTGLCVLVFFLIGRVSARKNKPEPIPAEVKRDDRDGKARIDVVRAAPGGRGGWTGRVADAHEGTPIRGARIWVERGTFEGRIVLTGVETGGDGRFVLPDFGQSSGDEEMMAEGRLHERLAQRLPPPSEVSIALVLRRRALLARLVAWAKRRGPPYDVRPEPTPGHVKQAAHVEGVAGGGGGRRPEGHAQEAQRTLRWADAVERAAFGPGEVDAKVEQEIDRIAPDARADRRSPEGPPLTGRPTSPYK